MTAQAQVPLRIESTKVGSYLLNITHPDGGPKARFFLGHGFCLEDLQPFAIALAAHGFAGWPGVVKPGYKGNKHVVSGPISTPNGTTPDIVTVWELKDGEQTARLITAYPN